MDANDGVASRTDELVLMVHNYVDLDVIIGTRCIHVLNTSNSVETSVS